MNTTFTSNDNSRLGLVSENTKRNVSPFMSFTQKVVEFVLSATVAGGLIYALTIVLPHLVK